MGSDHAQISLARAAVHALAHQRLAYRRINLLRKCRNLLIRAVRVSRPGTGTAVADYEDLREAWGVTPYLATRLGLVAAPRRNPG